jgi:hypothetical protein
MDVTLDAVRNVETVAGSQGHARGPAVVSVQLPDGTVIDVFAGVYHEALFVNTTSRSFTVRGAGGPAST